MTELALPGWIGAGEIDGVPLWRRASEPVYVAAADRDQLAFLDAALTLFDTAGPREFAEFVERRAIPRHEPSGGAEHTPR